MHFIPQPIEDYPFVALVFCPDGQTLTIPCKDVSEDAAGRSVILDFRGNALAIVGEGMIYCLLDSTLIEETVEETPDIDDDPTSGLLDRNYL